MSTSQNSTITPEQKREIVELAIKHKHDSTELVFMKDRVVELELSLKTAKNISENLSVQNDSINKAYNRAFELVKKDRKLIDELGDELKATKRRRFLGGLTDKLLLGAAIVLLLIT